MKRNIAYLQMAAILATIGAVLFFAKFHRFTWGDVAVLRNGATVNDVWYFNASVFSDAFLMSAFACVATQISAYFQDSAICWLIKYSSIAFGLMAICRAVFHVKFYDRVVVLELIAHTGLFIYTIYRAAVWYKINLKTKNEHTTDRCSV